MKLPLTFQPKRVNDNVYCSEASLPELIKQGDRQAYTQMYEMYHAALYNYILRFVKVPSFAEDVLQEVFIKLWEHRAKINPALAFKAYIYKISRNAVYDFIKKLASDQKMRTELINYCCVEEKQADVDIVSKQYEYIFQLAISKLPPQRRNVFSLCRQEGKKYEEVAELLHISRNTVKEHMVLAVKTVHEYVCQNTDIPMGIVLILLTYFTDLTVILPS